MSTADGPSPGHRQPAGRLPKGVRDMLLSLLVLLVIVVVFLVPGRGCSFAPGGPSVETGAAPSRDAGEALRSAASRVGFAVRAPEVPARWRATSSGVDPVAGAATSVVRVGWLTGAGGFLGLAQSDAPAVELVAAQTEATDVTALGSVRVDGREWTVYPGRRAERCWVTELDGVRVLVTGNAGERDFRALAGAVASAEPLPR